MRFFVDIMTKALVIQIISLTLGLVILVLWTLGVSRAIYEGRCRILKLVCKGCTVGFPSFLRYIVLSGACSCCIPVVAA